MRIHLQGLDNKIRCKYKIAATAILTVQQKFIIMKKRINMEDKKKKNEAHTRLVVVFVEVTQN